MITVTINELTAKGKALIQFLKQIEDDSFISFDDKEPSETTLKAIDEMKQGKVIKCKDVKDMFNKLNEK